ncbi:VanW family protein [uncultured Ezakiella sp.]|uniref:VanW family protein n=1 Tax=uncultured Ezakiella sp. TaxID=1637529 RepID=UPI0025E3E914|nr:VanW family protein [uncultured Ezakiella sp.]
MNKKTVITTSIVLAILVLAGLIYYFYNNQKEEEKKREILSSSLIYDGICVDNIDLSNKTKDQALGEVRSKVESILNKSFKIIIDEETFETTLKDLGLEINYTKAVDDAYNFGRRGSSDSRLAIINEAKENPINFETKTVINSDVLNAYIDDLNKKLLKEPTEAHVEFTAEGFNIIEGENGVEIDAEDLANKIKEAVKSGNQSVAADVRVKEAKTSNEMLERINGVIGEFQTPLGNGTQGRNENIKLSCKRISDRVIMPGETISFNDEMGEITAQNGYKMASTIVGGKYVDSLGGGLCQTSTTLYNALVRADVEIIERHPHSIAAPYVAVGADAAVWKGAKDLKFRNNWDFPIIIKSWVDNKNIYFKIYGDTKEKNYDIDLQTTIVSTIPRGRVEKQTDALQAGDERVVSGGRDGINAISTKIYKQNGQKFKELGYLKSSYPMQNAVVEVGTGSVQSDPNTGTENSDTENSGAEGSDVDENPVDTIDLLQ